MPPPLGGGGISQILQDACEILSGFYIESRYPPDMPEYSKAELADAFSKAKTIKEIIDSEINQ
jgi:hypothetical protein